MQAHHFRTTDLTPAEREARKSWFGSFKDGLQSLKPYRWSLESYQLTEIPVTTLPIFKIPMHFSMVLAISTVSSTLALLYFRFALWLCKLTKTQPSLPLHPLDFLGYEDVPDLSFIPGMKLDRHHKLTVLSKAVHLLIKEFDVVPVAQYAEAVSSTYPLRLLAPEQPAASDRMAVRS